jgi:Tfp pilus assembly protein PilO
MKNQFKIDEFRPWLIAGIMILVVSFILLVLVIIPNVSELSRRVNQFHVQNTKIENVVSWEDEFAKIDNQKKKLVEYLNQFYLSLPEEDRISTLISLLEHNAFSNNVDIKKIQPSNYIKNNSHLTIPLYLIIKGNYISLLNFIEAIEQSKYIIKIDNLNFKKEALDQAESNIELKMNVSVIILLN